VRSSPWSGKAAGNDSLHREPAVRLNPMQAMLAREAALWAAILSLIALIALCLLWESVLAPLRPGGSLLMLKALPLLLPMFGLLHGRVSSCKWTLLLALPYFAEGAVRAWSETGLSARLAAAETALAVALFVACALYVRLPARAAPDK
jgi:uncharacterized membrane protein